ncbi:MAG: NADH-quinone oxidoreductase subunit C [Dethiobacteria bacterium]
MSNEEAIIQRLVEKFDILKDRLHFQRSKRIFSDFLTREEFEAVLPYVRDEMGFNRASHVVGTDEGEDLGFIYLLTNDDGVILALKEKAPKSNPKIKALTGDYPSLEFHERELVGLFGAEVEGLPAGPPYPLPDGWPEGNYPLRKEWNPEYFDNRTMSYNPPVEAEEKEAEQSE